MPGFIRRAGMAQWREQSPLTKVARLYLVPELGVICGLSLFLVLVLAPRGFSPGSPVFPSLQKTAFPNFNSIWRVSPYCKAHLIISYMELYAIEIFFYLLLLLLLLYNGF